MKRLPWKNKWFSIILAFVSTMCLGYCVNDVQGSLVYSNSFISVVVCGLLVYGLFRIPKSAHWGDAVQQFNYSFGFLLLFITAIVCGVQLDNGGSVSFGSVLRYVSVIVMAVCGTPFLSVGLVKWQGSLKSDKTEKSKKCFLKVWILLILAYIPVLLASWPGFFTYDAQVESHMVFTEKYSAHHPITHVLLLGWIIRILYSLTGSYNLGIALYIFIQMIVVAACFAYMINFLNEIGVRKWLKNVSVVFLALFPTVSMFVCCSTKDVYFSAGLVLITTLLFEMAYDAKVFWSSKKKIALFIVASLIVVLFRNNGIYAFVVFLLFVIPAYKKYWKKMVPAIGAVFVIMFLWNTSVNYIFDVKPGPKAEMFCVPMQQLARMHAEAKEEFEPEKLEVLYSLIPEVVLENYNPKLADNVKVNFIEDNFFAEPNKYIELWIQMGLKRPDIYINSFLENTYGYWYPDTVIDGYTGKWLVTREYEDSSYFAFETEYPGTRQSLLTILESFYEKISLTIYQQKIPVVSMLFSMGFISWIYIFAISYLFKFGYKKQATALLLMFLVYLTMLLGPIAIVRYVLYYFFAIPLVMAVLFDTKKFIKVSDDTTKS